MLGEAQTRQARDVVVSDGDNEQVNTEPLRIEGLQVDRALEAVHGPEQLAVGSPGAAGAHGQAVGDPHPATGNRHLGLENEGAVKVAAAGAHRRVGPGRHGELRDR